MHRPAYTVRGRGRLRLVTESTSWVDMVMLTEPGRIFVLDPSGVAPVAVRPLLETDDRVWGDKHFVEICTPDHQRLGNAITEAMPTRAWHRENDTEPWHPRPSAWEQLGPVVTASIGHTQLLFGAPGDIRRLIQALEATDEFTFSADGHDELTHIWIGTLDPLAHGLMLNQLLAVGRDAGVLIASLHACRLPRL